MLVQPLSETGSSGIVRHLAGPHHTGAGAPEGSGTPAPYGCAGQGAAGRSLALTAAALTLFLAGSGVACGAHVTSFASVLPASR